MYCNFISARFFSKTCRAVLKHYMYCTQGVWISLSRCRSCLKRPPNPHYNSHSNKCKPDKIYLAWLFSKTQKQLSTEFRLILSPSLLWNMFLSKVNAFLDRNDPPLNGGGSNSAGQGYATTAPSWIGGSLFKSAYISRGSVAKRKVELDICKCKAAVAITSSTN